MLTIATFEAGGVRRLHYFIRIFWSTAHPWELRTFHHDHVDIDGADWRLRETLSFFQQVRDISGRNPIVWLSSEGHHLPNGHSWNEVISWMERHEWKAADKVSKREQGRRDLWSWGERKKKMFGEKKREFKLNQDEKIKVKSRED